MEKLYVLHKDQSFIRNEWQSKPTYRKNMIKGDTQMSYEDLTLSGFAKEMKEVSDGPHPRKFCFVLGAGASRSSGIKSGQELVNIWEKDLLERNKEGYSEWKQKFGINDSNK